MYFIRSDRIIAVSFFVYIFVNVFENVIHYSIGRFSNKDTKLEMPTNRDWVKIIVITLLFAALQGVLTYYFNSRLS